MSDKHILQSHEEHRLTTEHCARLEAEHAIMLEALSEISNEYASFEATIAREALEKIKERK